MTVSAIEEDRLTDFLKKPLFLERRIPVHAPLDRRSPHRRRIYFVRIVCCLVKWMWLLIWRGVEVKVNGQTVVVIIVVVVVA